MFFFYCHSHHRDLPSFPTRRSSDLRRHRFREPVALDELDIEFVFQLLGDGLGHGRAPAAQALEALEVVVEDLGIGRSEEHTSELQSPMYLVCRLLLEKKKNK